MFLTIFITFVLIRVFHDFAKISSKFSATNCVNVGKGICSCHMVPDKTTVCHRVVNFVRTVQYSECSRRGVEQSVNTSGAR